MLPLVAASVLAPTFGSLNSKQLPPSTDSYVFVSLGDNRPAGKGLPPTATFREILKEVSVIGPAFVISSGDLLYGNEESIDDYKQELVWMKPLIESLPCPFFNAPGNHEMASADFVPLYEGTFGATHGSFDFGKFRFVAVCTDLPDGKPGIHGDQLDWLKGVLATPKPTIVFQHHPVYPRDIKAESDTAAVDDAPGLSALYKAGGAQIVEEGHDHVYNSTVHDGVTYAIGGGAGAPLDAQPMDGGFNHFLLATVDGDHVSQVPIPLGALEVVPKGDGVAAVAVYSNTDLPIHNLRIQCSKKPVGVTASAASKKKSKDVPCQLVKVEDDPEHPGGFVATVSFLATHARATVVKVSY